MIPEFERTGPTPIYLQIKEWILQQVARGVWQEHDKLKSETDIAAELSVSRGTVRKAITELIDEGILVRIHGRGTFVASRVLEQPLAERLVAFSEDLMSRGIPFTTQVLEKKFLIPPESVASVLPVRKVFFLKRVRMVRQEPVVLLHNYVMHTKCPGIEDIDFIQYRLFQVLEEQFGLALDWGRRLFEARVATAEVARLLEISECAPVMYAEQIVYLNDGSPVELSHLWFRGDRFKLSATVRRNNAAKDSGATPHFTQQAR